MHNDPHIWTTQTPDGRSFKSVITGSSHADLVIEQTDITPYDTTNPLGARVGFRPLTKVDGKGVYACHSVEGRLLASLIKYHEQCGIQSDILGEHNVLAFLEAMSEVPRLGGNTAEHGMRHDNSEILGSFYHYFYDIPIIAGKRNPHSIPGNGDFSYEMVIKDGNLVFMTNNKSQVTFYTSDLDNAIKGLFIQAAHGLGRTSVDELRETLAFRYSPEFKEFEKRFTER